MTANVVLPAELGKHLNDMRGLERDYNAELLASRRNAWRVAAACALFGLIGMAAGAASLYRPAPDPVVLRVDNATGAVDVVTTMPAVETSYGEAVDTYWLNQYVLDRESYDAKTIEQTYRKTALMSAPEVQQQFFQLFKGPQARHEVLADRARVVVKVRSIQPNGKGHASIRFSTQNVYRDGRTDPAQPMIANVAYRYANQPMMASDRLVNPLGFQITSYRVDPEVGEY